MTAKQLSAKLIALGAGSANPISDDSGRVVGMAWWNYEGASGRLSVKPMENIGAAWRAVDLVKAARRAAR